MTKPITIDELLDYLEQTQRPIPEEGDEEKYEAIRAILERVQQSDTLEEIAEAKWRNQMTEPTIPEMLDCLERLRFFYVQCHPRHAELINDGSQAIRAILERDKDCAYVSCAVCNVTPTQLKDGESITFYCNTHDPTGGLPNE